MQPRKVSEGWRGGSLRARSNTLLSAGFTISISTYPACPPSWWRGGTKNNYRRHIRQPRPSSTSENDEEGTVRLGSGRFRASPGPAFCATHCVQFIFAANSRPGHQETPKRCYVRLIVVVRVARAIAARKPARDACPVHVRQWRSLSLGPCWRGHLYFTQPVAWQLWNIISLYLSGVLQLV